MPWTDEHESALQYWFDRVKPPTAVHSTLRKKSQRENFTPDEIRRDADVKAARFKGTP